MTKLLAGAVAAAALTMGLAAGQAAASAGCQGQHVTGSQGHKGVSVSCAHGGFFVAMVHCKRRDNGTTYAHYGPRTPDGGWSTAWCAAGADVLGWGANHA
ncbi:hypothetical protein GCM10022247_64550 [Allokutzneria multivorans]|uniref:Secreted protein n=1 Tax=Allokutzneria multivorans TaxID=1142134 RepID=A0ABP7TSB0_9PSEU